MLSSGLLQPPRRRRGRADDTAFYDEHVERLHFIRRALACGLTHDDIGQIVDQRALVTCGDVSTVAKRRIDAMRSAGRDATCLMGLYEQCIAAGARGARKDCQMLKELSRAGV